MAEMTKEVIVALCKANGGYTAPRLNDQLFLHCKGFHKIQNLEEYTDVKVLWLESNAISELSGLESQSCCLISLFVQNNTIRSLNTLQYSLHNLRVLNISNNYLTSLNGIALACPLLETLQASHNHIASLSACAELHALSKTLTSVDLSYNKIESFHSNATNNEEDNAKTADGNHNNNINNKVDEHLLDNKVVKNEIEETTNGSQIMSTRTAQHGQKGDCHRVNNENDAYYNKNNNNKQEDEVDDDIYIVELDDNVDKSSADSKQNKINNDWANLKSCEETSYTENCEVDKKRELEEEFKKKEPLKWEELNSEELHQKQQTATDMICQKDEVIASLHCDNENNSTNASNPAIVNDPLRLVNFFKLLPLVSVIYLHGNGIVRTLKQYRRNMILHLPALTYLDERPVFAEERRVVEAWGRGGEAAERRKRRVILEEKRAHLNSCVKLLTTQMDANRHVRDRLNAEWDCRREEELETLKAVRCANREARNAFVLHETKARNELEKEEQDAWWDVEDEFNREHALRQRDEAACLHRYKELNEMSIIYAEAKRELIAAGELSSESSVNSDRNANKDDHDINSHESQEHGTTIVGDTATITMTMPTSTWKQHEHEELEEVGIYTSNVYKEYEKVATTSNNNNNNEQCVDNDDIDNHDRILAIHELLKSDEEVMREMDAEIQLVLNSVNESMKAHSAKVANVAAEHVDVQICEFRLLNSLL